MQPSIGDRHFRPFFLDNPLRRFLSPPRGMLEGHVAKGMVVADLGCGPGYLSLPAAEMVGTEGKVYAVDFDPRSIAALTKKVKRRGLSGIIVARVSSAAHLDFIPDGAADLVIAKGLICCMLDHAGALREMHRVLRPGGTAFFSVTKLGSKRDGRWVDRDEWARILEQFEVEAQGEGWTNRWAWVRGRVRASAQLASPDGYGPAARAVERASSGDEPRGGDFQQGQSLPLDRWAIGDGRTESQDPVEILNAKLTFLQATGIELSVGRVGSASDAQQTPLTGDMTNGLSAMIK